MRKRLATVLSSVGILMNSTAVAIAVISAVDYRDYPTERALEVLTISGITSLILTVALIATASNRRLIGIILMGGATGMAGVVVLSRGWMTSDLPLKAWAFVALTIAGYGAWRWIQNSFPTMKPA